MKLPEPGGTYYTVEGVNRQHPEDTSSMWVTVFGQHHDVAVDDPTWSYGQVFTTREGCEQGAWVLRKPGMSDVYDLRVTPVVYLGNGLFQRRPSLPPAGADTVRALVQRVTAISEAAADPDPSGHLHPAPPQRPAEGVRL